MCKITPWAGCQSFYARKSAIKINYGRHGFLVLHVVPFYEAVICFLNFELFLKKIFKMCFYLLVLVLDLKKNTSPTRHDEKRDYGWYSRSRGGGKGTKRTCCLVYDCTGPERGGHIGGERKGTCTHVLQANDCALQKQFCVTYTPSRQARTRVRTA